MKEVILEIKDLDNPFEREKLEILPKDILVELLIRHLKRNIKAIEYIERLKNFKIKYAMLGKKELYASEKDFVKDLLDILRGEDNGS